MGQLVPANRALKEKSPTPPNFVQHLISVSPAASALAFKYKTKLNFELKLQSLLFDIVKKTMQYLDNFRL